MKWQAKATSTLKTAKWHPLEPLSPPHNKQHSYIHGHTHQPVMGDGAFWRPPKHSWALDRLGKKAWVKTDCLTYCCITHIYILLVYWCSYQITMKSVSWNCVCIRLLLVNLVKLLFLLPSSQQEERAKNVRELHIVQQNLMNCPVSKLLLCDAEVIIHIYVCYIVCLHS